jgi:hypothetical protein
MEFECVPQMKGHRVQRRTLLLPMALMSFSWMVLSISNERRMLTAYLSRSVRHNAGAAAAAANLKE